MHADPSLASLAALGRHSGGLHPIAAKPRLACPPGCGLFVPRSSPVAGANVFLLEALDGALSDAEGRFTITHDGAGTGHARRPPRRVRAGQPRRARRYDRPGLSCRSTRRPPSLPRSGFKRARTRRATSVGSTLTALEVVSTPGATADIARAMQTLPGVQNVDEGTGLFVRGGDVSETKVLLNNTVMLSPYNYETPTGNYTVTVNPFLLDGIFFSSGGFGARYGNILSGVADLRTQGRPPQTSITGVAGLASVSTAADLALDHGLTVHATAARNDTELLFKLNGATRAYSPAPNGTDVSGSVVLQLPSDRRDQDVRDRSPQRAWHRRQRSVVQRRLCVGLAQRRWSSRAGPTCSARSRRRSASRSRAWTATTPTACSTCSTARTGRSCSRRRRGAPTTATPSASAAISIGATRASSERSRKPLLRWHRRAIIKFDSRAAGSRNGAFASSIGGRWRRFASSPACAPTTRASRTCAPSIRGFRSPIKLGDDATITAAAGEYHQVSDPLYFASGLGTPGIGPMASRQFVVGWQLGESKQMARVELYDKAYQRSRRAHARQSGRRRRHGRRARRRRVPQAIVRPVLLDAHHLLVRRLEAHGSEHAALSRRRLSTSRIR